MANEERTQGRGRRVPIFSLIFLTLSPEERLFVRMKCTAQSFFLWPFLFPWCFSILCHISARWKSLKKDCWITQFIHTPDCSAQNDFNWFFLRVLVSAYVVFTFLISGIWSQINVAILIYHPSTRVSPDIRPFLYPVSTRKTVLN